jgi:predicted N-formylglutamate amidohydrolase
MRKLLISCEHGGNDIPPVLATEVSIPVNVLNSHRGLDIGALALAKQCSADAFYYHTVTRLLIDVNRSLHHPNVFSEFSRTLSTSIKQNLIQQYYLPYRQAVEKTIAQWIAEGHNVLHLSVHSFTPEFKGEVRNADIGLLYDPQRPLEVAVIKQWLKQFKCDTDFKVRCNYPYRGTADGFTTGLRKRFSKQYAGIELETNQQLWQQKAALVQQTQHRLLRTLLTL